MCDIVIDEFKRLCNSGFTQEQALAILNAVSNTTRNIDLEDLLPFHSWVIAKVKRRITARRKKHE